MPEVVRNWGKVDSKLESYFYFLTDVGQGIDLETIYQSGLHRDAVVSFVIHYKDNTLDVGMANIDGLATLVADDQIVSLSSGC